MAKTKKSKKDEPIIVKDHLGNDFVVTETHGMTADEIPKRLNKVGERLFSKQPKIGYIVDHRAVLR